MSTPHREPPPTIRERIERGLLGKPRDVTDRHVLHRMSLIAFLAWVGLGADGLSSSAYGPEEAFRALGEHTYLAIALAVATAVTVLVLSASYRNIIDEFPSGGGGYVVASQFLGAKAGVADGAHHRRLRAPVLRDQSALRQRPIRPPEAIDLALDSGPMNARLIVVAGNGSDVVHAGEPTGEGTGRDVLRHVYQASVGYRAPIGRGILFEAGIYPSHIGFESFLSKDNWNYTRAWQGEFSPYYQTGVKLSTSLSDAWSVQLHVLNGWQIVGETNDAKAIGTQVVYSSDSVSVSLNTFAGPELPNENEHWRTFGDLIVQFRVGPHLHLAGMFDAAYQSRRGRPPARWQAAVVAARYGFSARTTVALRTEVFHDPDNGISGSQQTLSGATATLEHRPHAQLIVKLEGRYDRSTRAVFSGRVSADDVVDRRRKRQALVVLGAVAIF